MKIIKSPSGACLKISINERYEVSIAFDNFNYQKNIDATGKTGEIYNRPDFLILEKESGDDATELFFTDYKIKSVRDLESLRYVLNKIHYILGDV